jgi:hypothetical protein
VTPASSLTSADLEPDRWAWPIDVRQLDTAIALHGNEKRAITELGAVNLRRLARHDPLAPEWDVVGRLLRPLDAVNAALDSPVTSHRRRAMADAVAVILLRCRDLGRSYWGWTAQEWSEVLGADQVAFRHRAPAWADEAVRPYLAPHAYLLGGFTEFHRLGSFSRLTLAWRVFGRDRVQDEIGRLRAVLAGWGYRLGREDDQLLPMVAPDDRPALDPGQWRSTGVGGVGRPVARHVDADGTGAWQRPRPAAQGRPMGRRAARGR